MDKKLSIDINDDLDNRLQAISEELKVSKNEFVLNVIQRFIHILEMKKIRSQLKGKAQQHGFNSEDDILSSFS